MDRAELERLLVDVSEGRADVGEALGRISLAPVQDLGFAQVDTARAVRQGVGEVIYGASKTPEQIASIAAALLEGGQDRVLITRVDEAKHAALEPLMADLPPLEYHANACMGIIGGMAEESGAGTIVVACAGTSDLPVAEEAALTAQFLGNHVERLVDVGVAGVHRLLAHADAIASASVVVAVAGMEGALASVVGGLTSAPVIAVPTSVGYGASYGGLAALLAMLNSCASGVSVVNVDNGFGAGYQAHLINHVGASGARG